MAKTTFFIFIVFFIYGLRFLSAQDTNEYHNIDKIVAIVGNTIILESEVQASLLEAQRQRDINNIQDNNIDKCTAFNALVMQKFLVIKAKNENITIDDNQVEDNINQRINFFARQVGSIELLEREYLGKPLLQFKEDIRPKIRESMLAEKAQSELFGKVTISPAEVESFYKNLPDSKIPLIDAEAVVGQIVIYPKYSESDLKIAKNKIDNIRERIIAGENFGTLASLYSQDPGSSHNNGELGFFGRAEMVPEFEAAAFKLSEPNEISPVIKTPYGFHILQLIARRGQQVNVRHILIKPTYSTSQLEKAKKKLSDILDSLKKKNLTFEQAAAKYSDDEATKQNLGFFVNPINKSNKITLSQLFKIDNTLTDVVSKLHAGEYSKIMPYTDPRDFSNTGYRFIYMESYIKPHKMNLFTDYEQAQSIALNIKKNKMLNEWFKNQEKNVYLNIQTEYKPCLDKENLFR